MSEQANEYGPVATRVLFDNDDVRVWEMDLAPGEVCGLHHHTMDYVLFILSGANVGAQSPDGRKMYIPTKYCHTNGKFFCQFLKAKDKVSPLNLVTLGGIVVVQVIQQVDLPIEGVKETSSKTESPVQQTKRRNNR